MDHNFSMTAAEIFNFLNMSASMRSEYLKKLQLGYYYGPPDFPPQVYVELTSVCNLKCIYCGYPDMKRPHQLMDEDIAKKVIDECAEKGVWYLTFQNYGEPLLAADYVARMIAYAKAKGVPIVNTTSNMTIMTEEIMKKWIEAGLDSFHMSFDGATPEKYKEVRGAKYEKVLENIKLARRVRNEMGLNRPFMGVTLVRTDETDEQVEDFKQMIKEYVDSIDVRQMLLMSYRAESTKHYEDLSENLSKQYIRNNKFRIPCRQIGSKIIVASNGEVTPCCTDVDAELSVGNVKESSLEKMWKSDKFGRLFMLNRQQRWDELPQICKNCKDWDWGGPEIDWKDRDVRFMNCAE